MGKGSWLEKEPWSPVHRKNMNYIIVLLFAAALFLVVSFHLFSARSVAVIAVSSESTMPLRAVTQFELVYSNRSILCLPVSKATVIVQAEVQLADGNDLPVTLLPAPPDSVQSSDTQIKFRYVNNSVVCLPVSGAAVSLHRPKNRTGDVKQNENENVTTTVASTPAATDTTDKAELINPIIDEEEQREIERRRTHNKVIRRWRMIRPHCDVYKGQWIYDNSYPFYNVSTCPYLRKEFHCQKYGRPDTSYLQFRWKPDGCDIPRFEAEDFLWRIRGKKIMFVGDSLSVNIWVSLVCMLHSVVPSHGYRKHGMSIARFEKYDVEIMNQWKPYLVDIEEEKELGRVLKLDSLQCNGTEWSGVDFLVFNTWYWWFRQGKARPFDFIKDGDKVVKDMNRMDAYAKALNTWASWISSNVDASKTRIIYQGVTPSHLSGREWGQPKRANCLGQKHPVKGSTYPTGPILPQPIIEKVLSTIPKSKHVIHLDITLLSQLRKDGHPSVYNGFHHMDCGHWCVGGVPDTWNQLLYAAIV